MHRLVVFACSAADREPLADSLVEHLGLTRTDAAVQARLAPGVIRGEFPEAQAHAAAAAIQQLGLQARVLPSTEVPVLHPLERFHHLRWPETGLEIRDATGTDWETIPWTSLDLVSVGQVPLDSVRHVVARSTTLVSTGRHQTTEAESSVPHSPGLELLLVCRDPFRVLRLEHLHLNYEFLGDRRTSGSAENFRLLITDLLVRAPHAFRTPATQAWLSGESTAAYHFDSPTALERSTQLNLLIHRLRG
jgi:hypothetical protein